MTPKRTRNRARAGFTLVEILVVTAIVAVAASLVVSVAHSARERARQTLCASNIRQITLGIQLYQQEHAQRFPDKQTIWQEINLAPKALICPSADQDSGVTYGYNAWLSGRTLGAAGMPAAQQLVLVSDSESADNLLLTGADAEPRHLEKANVGYADGHMAATEDVTITPMTDNELFSEQVLTWPSGYKAFYNLPYPSNYSYFNSLAIDPIPGWESNQYADVTNMVGPFGVGVASDQALWVRGFPYSYWKTKSVPEVYLRIPVPASANTITDGGMWVVCLPRYDYVNMGASMDFKEQYPPQMKGYAQVNVLDGSYGTIASFKLQLAGTSAEYSVNGLPMVTLENVAELSNSAWEENPAKGGWTYIHAWNYKYANAGPWWKLTHPHSLVLIGKSDGSVTCSLYAPDAPEVAGTVVVSALSGSNYRQPRWIEFRCSDVGEGHPGAGAIRVITQKYGGGILWGVDE